VVDRSSPFGLSFRLKAFTLLDGAFYRLSAPVAVGELGRLTSSDWSMVLLRCRQAGLRQANISANLWANLALTLKLTLALTLKSTLAL